MPSAGTCGDSFTSLLTLCCCPLVTYPLLLQVLFTAELNRRLAAAGGGVQALSLHPGNVLTNVVQSLPPAIQSAYRAIMARVLLTPEQGGAPANIVASGWRTLLWD